MKLMDVGRNALCPCGSGKKYKKCHLGREDELLGDKFTPDLGELASKIKALPPCRHPRAKEMAASLSLVSAGGKEIQVKMVDLEAYRRLEAHGHEKGLPPGEGGMLINPQKTRPLDPGALYLAISPGCSESTIVHQLAHAKDLVAGSSVPSGHGRALSGQTNLPVELLEHPQEYGEALLELSEDLGVTLDAEDEIIAFLARRRMLLPGKKIATGGRQELTALAEKTMRFMQDARQEIDARIQSRPGYRGSGKPKKR